MHAGRKTITTFLFSVLLLAGCGTTGAQKVPLHASPNTSATKGEIHYQLTRAENTVVQMKVNDLATPAQVESGATTYVVWAQALKPGEGNLAPIKVGELEVDADRTGEIATMVPYQSFRVFVTPESSSDVEEPKGNAVLWAEIFEYNAG